MNKILLLAGYNNAWTSVYTAEKLKQSGNLPSMILIAYPFSLKRIKFIIRNRGIKAIMNYIFKTKNSFNKNQLVKDELKSMGIYSPSLKDWAKKNKVKVFTSNDINSRKSVDAIKKLNPDVTAYTGGGIIKKDVIKACNNKILNAHAGRMPEIRGMNALEWSILLNVPCGITIHFIDQGIDTGEILDWQQLKMNSDDNLNTLRQKIVILGCKALSKNISKLVANENLTLQLKKPVGRQCYVLCDALNEIAEMKLKNEATTKN
jgi:methionyl-tRNA formyltransferase